MLDAKAVGDKINSLRSQKGLSQDQMAEKLFVTRQAVSRWELGQSLPSIDSLMIMTDLFGVSFEEILCLNQKAVFNQDDLFEGHSREFVLKSIIDGKLKVDLADVFYQFSPTERLALLAALKEKKIKADPESLYPRLTPVEQAYLGRK
jgi:transcriptional regulator with XRE-family HTH domain